MPRSAEVGLGGAEAPQRGGKGNHSVGIGVCRRGANVDSPGRTRREPRQRQVPRSSSSGEENKQQQHLSRVVGFECTWL